MRAFLSLVVLAASAVPAEAQLFCNPWRHAYQQDQLNAIRYQMLADQQRQQMDILRLQLQNAQPAASGAAPGVAQSVVIYLVQPGQPQQALPPVIQQPIPQSIPQTIPLDRSQPIVIGLPFQPLPQTVPIAGAPQQQFPIGGQPQQQLPPQGQPQQQLPQQGPPQQLLPQQRPPQQGLPPSTIPLEQPVQPPGTQPRQPQQALPASPQPSGYQRYTRCRPSLSRPLHH
jgi:hypothetical protein